MKSYKHLLIIILSLFSLGALAQTNKKTLNYQAVILDPNAIDIPGASITGQPSQELRLPIIPPIMERMI